jgi:3',5'-cyclic AMP phosphodiesterase CpdA
MFFPLSFLHISDLHVQADDNMNADLRRRFKTILANQRYIDHFLIITGDIIDNEGVVPPGTSLPAALDGHVIAGQLVIPAFSGPALPTPIPFPLPGGRVRVASKVNPAHLKKTKQAFANAHKLLKPFLGRIVFCPGNHDYRLLGNIRHPDFIKVYDKFQKPYLQALGSFQLSHFTNAQAWLHPFGILIIGLDSNGDRAAYSAPYTNVDAIAQFAKGRLSAGQLSDLDAILGSFPANVPRIVFLHHDPVWRDGLHELENGQDLIAKVRGKADLVLFGHKHETKSYPKAGRYGARHKALAAGFFGFPKHGQRAEMWEFKVTPGPTGARITVPKKRTMP